MRYLDGHSPNPDAPYGDSMHSMLTLSMLLAIIIGIGLYAVGRYGRILWMKVWSIGLILSSVAYLTGDGLNLF